MNNRIKELATKAREFATQKDAFGEYDVSFDDEKFEKKFAELIVQEVVNKQLALVANYETVFPGYEPVSQEFHDGTINGLKEGVELIQENFVFGK